MIIETLYDINQRVYWINNSIVCTGRVSALSIQVHKVTDVNYTIAELTDNANTKSYATSANSSLLYPTKEDAGKAWLQRNGFDIGLTTN